MVVILGILAAIVIPQFTSASETAKASSLTSQLQTIRSQLELYQVQHNGDYPALTATSWAPLTGTTNVSGAAATTGTTYGPYLQKPPVNAFENSSTIVLTSSGTLGTPRRRQGLALRLVHRRDQGRHRQGEGLRHEPPGHPRDRERRRQGLLSRSVIR